ncbi:MAG: ABC transporter permease [Burkholderiaceae bacterium]|nr:ABC transporter permease [Burkholderiaceae bacterium]
MRAPLVKRSGLPIVLLLLVVVGASVSPTFLSSSNLQNILFSVSTIGILALGQTVVMLVRQVDLSVGSLMAFAPISAVAFAGVLLADAEPPVIQGGNYVTNGMLLIMLGTLIASTAVGLVNGVLTVKFDVPSLIVTLGMLYMLRGASYLLSGGHPLYMTQLGGFNRLGTAEFLGLPLSFLVFLALGIVGVLVLRYTRVGTRIYATGGNEQAALFSGVRTDLWKIAAFGFSGFCAGLAALIYSSRLESIEAAQANGYELIAIAIVVIGGTTLEGGRGGITGTILAALILGVVISILSLTGLVIWYQTIIIGLVIVGAVFFYVRRERRSERYS